MRFSRKSKLFAGVAMVVAAGLGASAFGVSAQAAADDSPPSLIEDYAYPPNPAAAQRNLQLISGNGRIVYAECNGGAGLIRVRTNAESAEFCFEVLGPGFLSMHLDQVYQIRGDGEHDVDASISVNGATRDEDIPTNAWKILGPSIGEPLAVLLELRSE